MTHIDAYIVPAGNDAAPGVARLDAKAVNRKEDRSLYAGREKVYPQSSRTAASARSSRLVMAVTLGDRRCRCPGHALASRARTCPNQAVLLDMANNRFFFSSSTPAARSSTSLTGLLVLAALTLFLITSVAGRVWCGYTCPQTVWTDLMVVVERFWQGDRNARIALDKRRGDREAVPQGHDAPLLARHRPGDRRRLRVLLPRRADAGRRAADGHRPHHRLSLPRHLHAHHLRARRHRPRAGVHLHVPVAAHPGRHGRSRHALGSYRPIAASHAARTKKGSLGRAAAIASTAGNALRSVRPASTSATAPSSNASSARLHRCLQRDHGQGRPAAWPDRLRHHRRLETPGPRSFR